MSNTLVAKTFDDLQEQHKKDFHCEFVMRFSDKAFEDLTIESKQIYLKITTELCDKYNIIITDLDENNKLVMMNDWVKKYSENQLKNIPKIDGSMMCDYLY